VTAAILLSIALFAAVLTPAVLDAYVAEPPPTISIPTMPAPL